MQLNCKDPLTPALSPKGEGKNCPALGGERSSPAPQSPPVKGGEKNPANQIKGHPFDAKWK